MKVECRKLFLKALKNLKKQPIYAALYQLAFETLPAASSLQDLPNAKALSGTTNRYRIRVGNDRIGLEIKGEKIELMRVLHR